MSWWRADGNAADSAGHNDGTPFGKVAYARGRTGRAFAFDGTTGGIAVPDAPDLRITGSMTIDAWVWVAAYPSARQEHAMVLFRGDNRYGFDPYFLSVQPDGTVQFGIDSGVQALSANVATPIPLRRWVHVTATLDADRHELSVYLNRRLQARTATVARPFRDLDAARHPAITIGNSNDPGFAPYPFNGRIDELKVYAECVPPGRAARVRSAGR